MKRTPKYRNRKTEVDGITFASKAEARRYGELKLLEKAGEIENLILQPRYRLRVEGANVGTYVGDFFYLEDGRPVVEDVKGVETAVFRLKAKMFRATYPDIELRVVKC